jgi:hypothetical protein
VLDPPRLAGSVRTHARPAAGRRGPVARSRRGDAVGLEQRVQEQPRALALRADGSKQASQIGIGGWGLGVVVYMITHSPAGSAVFAVSLVAAIGAAHRARTAARAAVGPRCAEAAPAVAQIAGGFQFTSESYALAFAGENRERLLSTSPALRRQLELPCAVVVTRRGDPDA